MRHLPLIYCDGYRAYAYCVCRVWFCARCGARVRIVT
jgi:hypothetical protein